MKLNALFLMMFLLLGASQIQSQIGPAHIPTHDGQPETRRCADLVVVNQVCEDDGTVTVNFRIINNSNFNVTYIRISDGNGWSSNCSLNLPSQTGGNKLFTYTGAVPGSQVCFLIKFYNADGFCCFSRVCIRIRECPCAEVINEELTCVDGAPGTYEYCFEVVNPAYSNNTIDQITVFTGTPDLCLDGDPIPTTISISPIAPGSSDQVCVTLTGCNSPLVDGVDIDLTLFLEDTSDPAYCCHVAPAILTTASCCIGEYDCTDYKKFIPARNGDDVIYTVLDGLSDVNATLAFRFATLSNPDQLVVRVNGNIVIDTGPWSTNGVSSPCTVPQSGIYQGQIDVEICDEISVIVYGDVINCGFIWWNLEISCVGNLHQEGGAAQRFDYSSINNNAISDQVDTRIDQSKGALSIYPNPVRDILTIKKSNSETNYESVKVMDSSGRIVLTEDMSGRSDLKLDTSALPGGTYLLEIIDDAGNRTVEKILKL